MFSSDVGGEVSGKGGEGGGKERLEAGQWTSMHSSVPVWVRGGWEKEDEVR